MLARSMRAQRPSGLQRRRDPGGQTLFIKRKKVGRQTYFYLARTVRTGKKVRPHLLYLGRSVALTAERWTNVFIQGRAKPGFTGLRTAEILRLVDAHVREYGLPYSTLAGLREAMKIDAGKRVPTEAHRLLGVPAGATVDEIKTAFRRLVKDVHPDPRGGSGDGAAFRKLVEARDRLLGLYKTASGSRLGKDGR